MVTSRGSVNEFDVNRADYVMTDTCPRLGNLIAEFKATCRKENKGL